jgi:hypothetical protein
VAAVPPTLSPGNIGECFLVGNVIGVDTIPDTIVVLGSRQNARYGARRYVGNIVGDTAAVGKARTVAAK